MIRLRSLVVGLTLVACAAPVQAADPFVLFLLRMLRDQSISSSIEAGVGAAQRPGAGSAATAPPFAPPVATSESEQLKAMIEESFVHLGPQQREELHASLMRILNDPKNAAARGSILSEFNAQAMALRNSQRMLSRLSESDMRVVAAEARAEYEKLPADQRRQLLQALQNGVPGMPRALHDLMLAEFRSVPATP